MSHCQTQKEYYKEIREIALQAARDEASGEGAGDFSDNVHEAVDWHPWIIYTYSARWVLVWTNNAMYAQDEGLCEGRPETVEQEAFWAMYGDVMDLQKWAETQLQEERELAEDKAGGPEYDKYSNDE